VSIETGVHYPLNLNDLPDGWRAAHFGEFAERIEPGFASGEHNQTGAGIPHLRPMNIDRGGRIDLSLVKSVDSAKDKRRLAVGDVLFNNTNSPELVGKTAVISQSGEFAFSNHMTRIQLKESVLPKFAALQFHLLWMRGYFKYNCVKHVNQASISSKTLAQSVPFIWAPLAQQEAIVAELEKQFSRLDEAVANLQRVKANLKRYKDSVYSEAFGKAPNSTLGDLIEVGPQNGLYLPKDMYGDGVPILRIDDYQTAWIRPVQELRRVKATQEQISTWALCEDDLVVNRVNSMTHLGKCARIPKSLTGSVFESNMMRMRLASAASPAYVEHYLASRLGKKRLTGNAKWAVNQASINQKDVRATPIFVPDLAAQLALVTEIDRQLSIVREVEAEVDTNLKRAQALRQATLASAFSSKH
jgi:type I restriction enzyme S subunit